MIVGTRPQLRRIVMEIWKPLTALFAWDVAVTAFHFICTPIKEPPLPIALFGTALALFLGFRTNAAYARWWEARTLWGALINASRTLSRIVGSVLPGGPEFEVISLRQIAFAHTMRLQLRGEDSAAELDRLIGPEAARTVAARTNRPNALLEAISRQVSDARSDGRIDSIQQELVERTLTDIANAQGGMERIKSTPLPAGFRFLPSIFTRVFCLLLPIAMVEQLGLLTPIGSTLVGLVFLSVWSIGEDLTDPFANTVHDVPLSAMCRTIEIDLTEALGRTAPEKLGPVHDVLW